MLTSIPIFFQVYEVRVPLPVFSFPLPHLSHFQSSPLPLKKELTFIKLTMTITPEFPSHSTACPPTPPREDRGGAWLRPNGRVRRNPSLAPPPLLQNGPDTEAVRLSCPCPGSERSSFWFHHPQRPQGEENGWMNLLLTALPRGQFSLSLARGLSPTLRRTRGREGREPVQGPLESP